MYIKERIFGVFVFYSILFTTFVLLYNTRKHRDKKNIILIFLINLCIMAFLFKPNPGSDLYRLFNIMDYYSTESYKKIFEYMSQSATPFAILYFKLISTLKNNHFLPTITCFLYYGIIFNTYIKFCKKYEISNKSMAISLLIFMISGKFIGVISGVRNGIAFVLIFKCIYNEIIEEKSVFNNILYYCIAILMHSSSLVIIGIRLIIYFMQKEKNVVKKMWNIIIIMVASIVFMKYGIIYIKDTYNRGLFYMTNSTYFYIWEHIIAILNLILIIITIRISKKITIKDKKIMNLQNFIKIMYIITLFCIIEHSTFVRFQSFTSLLFLLYDSYIIELMKKKNIYLKRYSNTVYMLISIIFFIAITRGNISSLKFF